MISCVNMANCEAFATMDGEKLGYKGVADKLNLYHDPSGNPIG
jgi:hypothetical protein